MAHPQPPFTGKPPLDRPSSPDLLVETVTQRPVTGPIERAAPPRRPPWALVALLVVLGLAALLGVFLMPDEPDPARPVAYGLRIERPDGTVLAGAAAPGDRVVPVVLAPAVTGDAPFAYLLQRDAEGLVHRLHPAEGQDTRLAAPDARGRVPLPAIASLEPGGTLLLLVISDRALAEPRAALSRLGSARTRSVHIIRRPLQVRPAALHAADASGP